MTLIKVTGPVSLNEIKMPFYICLQASTSIGWWIHISISLSQNSVSCTVHLWGKETTQNSTLPLNLTLKVSRSISLWMEPLRAWYLLDIGRCYWHNYILKLPFCSSTRTTWLYHASLFCKDAPWNLDSMSIVLIMSLFPFPISIGQGLSMEILKNLYPLMHFHLLERTLFLPVMLMLTYVMIVQQETLSHEYHTWSIRLWFTSSQRSNPHRDCLLRSEYMAARMATEKIIEFWTTLHYLWIPIKSASYLFGDNKTVVDISLNLDSKLNKRHVLISYHRWGR